LDAQWWLVVRKEHFDENADGSFSTDYGLMSLAVIAFVLVMAVYFLRVFWG